MMKILAIFSVLIALSFQAKAGEFDHLGGAITAPWATIFTNNITAYSTNAAGNPFTVNITNTFLADKAIYHDFQEIATNQGTNTIAFILSKSINGSDFVPFSTNTTTSLAGTYTNFDVTVTGIGIDWRETVLFGGTNAGLNIYYAGH